MKKFLSTFRWFVALPLVLVLMILVAGGLPVVTLSNFTTDADQVKGFLAEAEIYDHTVDTVVELGFREAGQAQTAMLMLAGVTKTKASSILKEITPLEWIQTQSEKVIDGFYLWLRGEADHPEFEIDLSDRVTRLSDKISELTGSRALANEILKGNADRLVFKGSDLTLDEEFKRDGPEVYNILSEFLLAFMGGFVFLVVFILLLVPGWRAAVKTLSIAVFLPSLVLTITAFFLQSLGSSIARQIILQAEAADREALTLTIQKPLGLFVEHVNGIVMLYSLAFLVMSIALYLLARRIKTKEA